MDSGVPNTSHVEVPLLLQLLSVYRKGVKDFSEEIAVVFILLKSELNKEVVVSYRFLKVVSQ